MSNSVRNRRILFASVAEAAPSYTQRAQELFDACATNAGEQLPTPYKTIYNQYYKDLLGTGNVGSNDVTVGLKVLKGCVGYSNGSNYFMQLCDLLTPTATLATAINGGGNYVNNVGTDTNVYARESVSLKCWNSKVIPSAVTGLTQNDAGYSSWSLVNMAGSSSGLYAIGCADGSSEVSMQRANSTTQSAFAVHDGTYIIRSFGGANNKGYMRMARYTSTIVRAFKGITQLGADGSIASINLPTKEIMMFGFSTNNGGAISQTGAGQKAAVGLAVDIPSLFTSAMQQQFIDATTAFCISLGIASPSA